jgi:D-galactarolactone cycloisomerase
MNRRGFLASLAASAAGPSLHAATPPVKIARITLAPIEGRFHRFVAMNSQDQRPKGHTYTNTLVRIFTDQGVEGAGVMEYALPDAAFLAALRPLIGANPLELYGMNAGRIVSRAPAYSALLSRYMHLDGPLYDLIGKLQNVPCWKLIGDAVRERIEVYDAQLYFSDVWFKDRGVRAVMEESEEAAKSGYLGLKYKIGRGWRWMEKDEGLKRDIEVMRAARKLLGPRIRILTDANNGWLKDIDRTWRFLNETADLNLYWLEEPFPEDPALYGELKDRMEKARMKTLLADGENIRQVEAFAPYLKPRRLMDAVQMDIRRGGFLGCLEMARMGEAVGAVAVPHNWGSQIGTLMSLQLAKAAKPVVLAEDDRSTCDVISAEGYAFRKGHYTVPDDPGMGIRVIEPVYKQKYQAQETVVS